MTLPAINTLHHSIWHTLFSPLCALVGAVSRSDAGTCCTKTHTTGRMPVPMQVVACLFRMEKGTGVRDQLLLDSGQVALHYSILCTCLCQCRSCVYNNMNITGSTCRGISKDAILYSRHAMIHGACMGIPFCNLGSWLDAAKEPSALFGSPTEKKYDGASAAL